MSAYIAQEVTYDFYPHVDTGYGLGHPDLPDLSDGVDGHTPSEIPGSWDVDGRGHGTHCAGTIGAIGGNDVGVVGVLPNRTQFQFYIGKGLDDSGWGSNSDVMDAVQACVDAGSKIISMSLGGGNFSTAFNDQLESDYKNNGTLIIASAGT